MSQRFCLALVLVVLTTVSLPAGPPTANAQQGNQAVGTSVDEVLLEIQWTRISSQVQGLVYMPVGLARPETALVVMHPEANFMQHFTCEGMARRGFMVLCANGRGTRDPDELALDVKAPVHFLRQQFNVKNVVLIGHSGGGPMMTYYQNVAENGLAACQGPEKIVPCSDDLANMSPADALILLDAHHGSPLTSLFKLDPSVLAQDQFGRTDRGALDPSLDPFLPANGFSPTSDPTYTNQFLDRYYAGQSTRRQQQTDLAMERLALVQAGLGMYPDNEPFIVSSNGGRIWEIDRRLLSRTKGEHRLLTPNGIVTTIAHSIRPRGSLTRQGSVRFSSADVTDLRDFLSTAAVRTKPNLRVTEDDIVGVDWFSQNGLTVGSLAGIRVPVLNISATGHYWVVPNEISYSFTASADKELIYIEGATHGFTPCNNCVGAAPGKYDNVTADTLNYMADWIKARFGN